ncbi:translocase of chloroplast 101, chloroplastic-like [Phragmites australis]|uniref:translocase of chloroplast 101, chloroplastic-like n=1 Tax=Phragmites australis TaxID=29695 RepID=UPI002D78E5C0|nr:translocase of chloroplast 101, chloroplastic-like [Phragmites australis]
MDYGFVVGEEGRRPEATEDRAGENGGVAEEEEEAGGVEVAVKPAVAAEEGDGDVVVEGGDEGDVPVDVKRPPGAVAAQEGDGEEVGKESGGEESVGLESKGGGPGGGAVEPGVSRTDLSVVGDHQAVATPNTRLVLENGRLAAVEWDEDYDAARSVAIVGGVNVDGPCAEIDVEEDTADDDNQERVAEKAMAEAIQGYVTNAVLADHTNEERLAKDRKYVATHDNKPEAAAQSEGILVCQSKDHPEKSTEEIASCHSKPELVTQSAAEPDVVIEELDDMNSSDDENTATSAPPAQSASGSTAPPAQSSSAASGRSNGPSLPSRPAGLGSSSSLSQPSARPVQQVRANGPAPVDRGSQQVTESAEDDGDENDDIHEKLQMIRVKFLRLAHRFGQTHHNMVVSQVLYRLGLAEQLRRTTTQGVFSFDRAREMAERLEAAGNEPLDFSCTILVLGKTGVGKSATINSIFDDTRLDTNAFDSSTRKVQEVVGMVEGVKVKVIDTPGLSCSSLEQHHNQKVLNSVKRLISKNPPDIVLYFDRLDMQSRDNGDVPLLQTITKVFGASVWFNAIVVLTHAASAPPDGLNGIPLSYEMFVTQRSHVVQQAIRQAAGDVRLMNPVSLVENHSACRTNRAGQRVLPNGQVWKPQLLLLCFASKVLAEANMLLKLQDSPIGKPSRTRIAPLPFLLSSLLQSRPPLKLPEEQFGDDDDLEDDLVDDSDSDDGSDYDDLPPFKRLTKAQLAKLNNAQRKAYLEELDYREKLFYKRQLKEERMRRRMMKKMAAEARARGNDFSNSNPEDDSNTPTNVAVPMPDMVLPSSFDSDYPSHRYRFLDTPSEWLVRPVLETQGWDHDVGYEGLNVERLFAVKGKVPLSVSGQLTKDKKDCSLQMEVASSVKHAEGKTTSLGLDLQSVGKDMAYTIRGESRFKNFRRNNTAAGISATLLGDSVSAGVKIEDKLIVNKQHRLLVSGGAMSGRGDVAYGGRLEATLRDKDYPIGRMLSTLALSVVDWHGDLAVGCNIQSQIPVGRASILVGHANLSNKGTGQVGIRLNSSEHLQIALIAFVPILKNIRKLLQNYSEST